MMEVDTGAAVSVQSEQAYKHSWPSGSRPRLQNTSLQLQSYLGDKLPGIGQISVKVCYNKQEELLDLVVIAGKGPTLMGRSWLERLDVLGQTDPASHHIHTICNPVGLKRVLDKHQDLFKEELGLIKGVKAKIYINKEATPKCFKPRQVPFALRNKVEMELDRLERGGILQSVQFSEWAAPVVPVVKRGGIRVCGDYKLTVNPASSVDPYPLPRINELLASTARAKIFSKLDLSYLQLELEEDSKPLTTISTHKELYKFGLSFAPAVFQRTIEGILGDIPKMLVYIDNILVFGTSEEEHLRTLDAVLTRLEETGMRLKLSKCFFRLPSIKYLEHKISAEEIQLTEEKKRAILEAPTPQNMQQLRSFLGLLNYNGKFLPHLTSTLAPVYCLLKKHTRWHWNRDQDEAFHNAKQLLTSAEVLTPYDPKQRLVLLCDASPYGIGAVLPTSSRMAQNTPSLMHRVRWHQPKENTANSKRRVWPSCTK